MRCSCRQCLDDQEKLLLIRQTGNKFPQQRPAFDAVFTGGETACHAQSMGLSLEIQRKEHGRSVHEEVFTLVSQRQRSSNVRGSDLVPDQQRDSSRGTL